MRRKSDILLLIWHYLRYICYNLEEQNVWQLHGVSQKPLDAPHFCSHPAQNVPESINQSIKGTKHMEWLCLELVRSKNINHLESAGIPMPDKLWG